MASFPKKCSSSNSLCRRERAAISHQPAPRNSGLRNDLKSHSFSRTRAFNCSRYTRKLDCRLLLGHAVDGAQSPDEVAAVDADDVALGEQIREDVEGYAIVRVVEHRDQHNAVCDVEVGVGRWQTLAAEDYRSGHREFNDVELAAVLVGEGFEPANIVGERFVVRVVLVRLNYGDDRVLGDEPRNVIHVAVRVVTGNAAVEPENCG